VGFKPFLALFYLLVSETNAADLRVLTPTLGDGFHSLTDYGNGFFYFNHTTEQRGRTMCNPTTFTWAHNGI